MNRDRIIEINKLLLSFKKQIEDNPDKASSIISHSNIYYYLVRTNTPERISFDGLFNYWTSNNNRSNTNVFVSPDWKYFCQFISQIEKMIDSTKHRKIYLSLKPSYLMEGVDRLFDFLSRENIPHESKVGKKSRDDQIVVRVGSHEDCLKVVNFIKNDPYIQEGKKKANPFSFQYEGVALTSDGITSYNGCITCIIKSYLQEMKNNNTIDSINVNTFIDYCIDYYNRYFVYKSDIKKLFEDFELDYKYDSLYELIDYKYCMQLFLNGLKNGFDLNKYEKFVDDKEKTFDKELKQFSDEYYGRDNYLTLFTELCVVMIGKKGYYQASNLIKHFIYDYDITCVTRDNDLRRRVNYKGFINHIKKYLNENDMSLDSLISKCYEKGKLFTPLNEGEKLLREGVIDTYNYHQELFEKGKNKIEGYRYAMGSLIHLVSDGSYNGFTRNNDVRQKIADNLTRDDVITIIKNELGIDKINREEIEDICNSYIHKIMGTSVKIY